MSDENERQVREGSRIAKVMARAGLCSRREAEAWVAAGRVTVNGKVLQSPAYNVSDEDDVRVDGAPLSERERTRLFFFHKPRGFVTTARDPEGRPTIFNALPKGLPRLVAVGRLDINSEGLMLLTNDGGLARVLELPATGWLRRYRVRAHGAVDQAALDALADGVTVEGVHYAGIEARLDREQGSNAWITMGLREGKNREIKRVLEHLGLSVNRLIRISFGPFELGDLPEGQVVEVRTRVLRDQLGVKLAKEAGVDFEAPVLEHGAPEQPVEDEKRKVRPPPRERDAGARRGRPAEREEVRQSRGRPAPSTPERRRKHVSALRAEIAADTAGPRKRVERSATHDRKGRTIAVERMSTAGADGRKAGAERKAREAKGGSSKERRERRFEPGRDTIERPRRPDPFGMKRARDGEGRERPPRGERKERGASDFKPRGDPKGAARGAGPPRRDRSEREGARAGQSFEGRRESPRGGSKPPHRNGTRKFGGPKSGARGAVDGAKPRSERPAGGRGGRPPGKGAPKGSGGPRQPPRKR